MVDSKSIEEKEYQRVVALLGREPKIPFIVKTRCANGSPQILLANPVFFEDNILKPFPSFLWLVCPRLKALVADLEQQGFVKYYSQKLKNDEEFRNEYLKGQKRVAEYRWIYAQELFDEPLPQHIINILRNTSVAGSHDILGVKCLHAHLAHYLAFGNNPIGKEILEKIGKCTKEDNCGCELLGGEK